MGIYFSNSQNSVTNTLDEYQATNDWISICIIRTFIVGVQDDGIRKVSGWADVIPSIIDRSKFDAAIVEWSLYLCTL